MKKDAKPTLNIKAASAAATEKSPSHPSMFPIKRTLKAANRSHNMSAANFRKWKAEGFAPSKKPTGRNGGGAKGGGAAGKTRRRR